MILKFIILLSTAMMSCTAQRAPYAGRRPIGYPEIEAPSTSTVDPLSNKFGEGDTVTTERLPIEALGDRDLVNRLLKLPVDKQPFWLLNWKALESHRKSPQTFQLKPNPFIGPAPSNGNSFDQNPSMNDNRNSLSNQNLESTGSIQENGNLGTNAINSQNSQQVQNQNMFSNNPDSANSMFGQNTQQIQNQNRFLTRPTGTNDRFGQNTQQFTNQNRFSNNPIGSNTQSGFGGSAENNNRANNFRPINNQNRGQSNTLFTNSQHTGDLNDFINRAPSTNSPKTTTSKTYQLFLQELQGTPSPAS